ncbi:MAG TPA: hypothetical protein VIV11_28080, partial [Kofleriaceae bacterium]
MWLVGLFTYFAARAVDEHRFAVAMSKLVMPSKDVDQDVERLSHENPDQAARDMAHRLEVRSAALPVLAAGVMLPVTALYVAAIYRAGGWPVIADFEGSVAAHAKALLLCGGAGAVIAIAMTKRWARLPMTAPMTIGAAIACVGLAAVSSPWLVPLALILVSVAIVVRKLRKERDQLQAEDPAAGSEIFTIRGFIRQVRESSAAAIARVRKVRTRSLVIAGGVIAVGVAGIMFVVPTKSKPTAGANVAAIQSTFPTKPVVAPTGSSSRVSPMGDGRLKIEVDLVDDRPIDLPSLAGLAHVPPMWLASMKIEQIEGLSLQVSPFGDEDMTELSIGTPITMLKSSCSISSEPLSLRLQGQPGHYVLFVAPTLTPAGC